MCFFPRWLILGQAQGLEQTSMINFMRHWQLASPAMECHSSSGADTRARLRSSLAMPSVLAVRLFLCRRALKHRLLICLCPLHCFLMLATAGLTSQTGNRCFSLSHDVFEFLFHPEKVHVAPKPWECLKGRCKRDVSNPVKRSMNKKL